MFRKAFGGLAIVAVAAMTIVGCGGKEDVTDLQDTWTKQEQDLTTKLNEVKTEHQDLMTKWSAMPAATTDSVAMAERSTMEASMKDHEAQIAEIEATIAKHSAAREAAMKTGTRAEFEAAWNAAKVEFEGAMAKLDELDRQHDDLSGRINNTATPAPADTTTGATSGDTAQMKKDTNATS